MSIVTRRQSGNLYLEAAELAAKKKCPILKADLHCDRVAAAARAVNSRAKRDHLSYRKAAHHYGVSVGAIQSGVDRLRSGKDPKAQHSGAATSLKDEEERFLVECILRFGAQDMCLGLSDLQKIVDFITVGPRKNHNNHAFVLSDHWRAGFLNRHRH